jgi:hypothetical protein
MPDDLPRLYVEVVQHPEGLVGECFEIPIIVQGQNMEEIREKIHIAIKGYFDAFPWKKEEILNKERIVLDVPIPK